jgi:hypothetical protein
MGGDVMNRGDRVRIVGHPHDASPRAGALGEYVGPSGSFAHDVLLDGDDLPSAVLLDELELLEEDD